MAEEDPGGLRKTADHRWVRAGAGVLRAIAAGACLLIVRPAAATPEELAAALRETFGDRPITPGRIKLEVPRLAENGNIVPVTITVDSPMTEQDYVKSIHLFAEKQPATAHPRRRARTAQRPRTHRYPGPYRRLPAGACRRGHERRHVVVRCGRCRGHSGRLRTVSRFGKAWVRLIGEPETRRAGRDPRDGHASDGVGIPARQCRAIRSRAISSTASPARYGGKEVFRATLHPAMSANPYFVFYVVAAQQRRSALHLDGRSRQYCHAQRAVRVDRLRR